jgi:glycosyltransferase involved in cell wall biosynthesis
MNIAIDLTQIPADKTGIGIYALNLVREMCRLNLTFHRFHFFFFIQDDDDEFINLLKDCENCTLILVKSTTYRKMIPRFYFEQILLPHHCRKRKIDLIFSTHYTIPFLTRIKRVAVFHDMTFYLFPEMHQKIKRLYFKTLIPMSANRSSAIITVSESTKKDMLERFTHLNAEKITVIHHGVDRLTDTVKKGKEQDNGTANVLGKYGLTSGGYFLFVGTLEPRKNITGIVKAFHHLRKAEEALSKKYKLVIVGKKGWFYKEIFESVKKHHLEDSVVFTGYVDEEEKQVLLRNAFIFLYPSYYEGFGIPILEAMACGTPVITGNVSALPEVAGDAAVLVPPRHWQEISTSMLKLLSDPHLHEKLSQKGLEQAAKFSWEKTAEKTMELFEKIALNEHR